MACGKGYTGHREDDRQRRGEQPVYKRLQHVLRLAKGIRRGVGEALLMATRLPSDEGRVVLPSGPPEVASPLKVPDGATSTE